MRRYVLALASITAVAGAPGSTWAQTFAPAKIAGLPDKTDFECPRRDGDSSVLFCRVAVSETGSVVDEAGTQCMGLQRRDARRARRLRKSVTENVTFEPATVDDRPMPIATGLRIDYLDNEDDCAVLVSANLGIQATDFGINYSAPQLIRRDAGLSTQFRRSLPPNREYAQVYYLISVAVDLFGEASDGRVDWVVDDSQSARARSHADALATEQFIPAFVDGVPTAARYYEYLYVRRNAPGIGIPQDTSSSQQEVDMPGGVP